MVGKFSLLLGFGAGYVLGARSGRERYEQIASKAQEFWSDPRVQQRTGQAQQLVKEKAGAAGSMVSDKVKAKSASDTTGAFSGTGGSAS